MLFQVITVVSLAAISSAQSLFARSPQSVFMLSTGCSNTLATIAANPGAAACLSPSAVINVLISGDITLRSIDNWLSSFCAIPACSNAALSSITTSVIAGCAEELLIAEASPSVVSRMVTVVQQNYPTIRKLLCLRDSNTNCITQTLINIGGVPTNINIDEYPTTVTCSDCMKAAYNVIKEANPSFFFRVVDYPTQSQCGVSFVDGNTPPGISQSAPDTTPPHITLTGSLLTQGAFSASCPL